MTISATSQGLRPGVCVSTARPATPFDGQVIYETDTNRVLVWDNAAWVMIADTDSPPGLQLIKTQTIGSAVSSATVSDAFNSDYENYLVSVSGGVASAGIALNMKLGASATGYSYSLVYSTYASASAVALVGGTAKTVWEYVGTASANHMDMSLTVNSPNLSKWTVAQGRFGSGTEAGTFTGVHQVATAYTDFTITTSSGTMTGGTIRVYGYRNS